MEKAKCPKCQAIIDHLNIEELGTDYINEYVRRYGTSDLSGEDIDIDDTDCRESETTDQNTDETNYYCPECEASIIPEELEIIGEDGNGQGFSRKPQPLHVSESGLIEKSKYCYGINLIFFVCSCGERLEAILEDGKSNEEIICFHCGKAINQKTAKKVIKI